MDKHNDSSRGAENPYLHAYRFACESLRRADIEERARKSGASFEKRGDGTFLISLSFLSRCCIIDFPQITITYQDEQGEVPLWSKIVVLHYLINAQGLAPTGDWISFRQISGGDFYYPAFEKRSEKPLLSFFAERMDLFQQCALALGGEKTPAGDMGIIIPALPRVPLALIFWRGDEEFPPEARILFDSTIPAYLSTEDVAVLSQQAVYRLIALAGLMTGNKRS